MVRPILLDTDVIVDFFRGHVKAEAFINTYNARIILCLRTSNRPTLSKRQVKGQHDIQ
jgi:hypothetical protein